MLPDRYWWVVGFLCPALAIADGSTIDKVYDPYVQPLEQELEYRIRFDDDTNSYKHWLAYGQAINDRWFVEGYLIAEDDVGETLEVDGYELEAKWQLTEQGEYFVDVGMLYELEKERGKDAWEVAMGMLLSRDFGKSTLTANAFVGREWGRDIRDEWETKASLQWRYRYSREVEPAIEFYAGEDTLGAGPLLMGSYRLPGARKLMWQFGVIFALDADTAHQTVKGLLEYEF